MISSFSPRLEADRLAGTLLPKKRPLEPDHLSSLKNKKTRISTPSPILLVPVQTMKDEEATCKPDASLRATKEGNPCETVKIAVDAFKSVLKEKLPNHEYVIVEKRLTKRMGAFNGNFLTDKKLIKLITEKERMVKSSDADSSYFHIKIVLDELKVYTIKADAVAAAAVVEPSHEDRKMEDSVLPGFRVKTEPALSTTEPMKKMVKLTAVASTDNKKESEVKKDCSPEFSIRETNESPVVVPGLNGNPESIPCSSKGSKTPEDDNPASSKLKKKPSKHHVVKLKKALKQCQKEIEKLEVKEVDFENEDDDTYLRVSRYKSKMVQIYKKLADIEGREANMGRQTDKTFKFKGTRYPEINQKISRFVNKRKDRGEEYFPDYKDVLTIFEKCNEAHGLGLTGRGMAHEAEEAFKTIGRMLQKRRVDDDHMIMLSYLSEGEADVDPAENVPEMEQKLRASETERENKMTKVSFNGSKQAIGLK